MKKIGTFLLAILLPITVGVVSAALSKNGIELYKAMEKPPLSPPASIFPLVWTVLYFMMGVASYLIFTTEASVYQKTVANILYFMQLALNFFWTIIFFNFQLYAVAFIWLIIMFIIIINCTVYYFYINRKAGWLMVPYNIWMVFATYLNLAIVIINVRS